MRNALVMSLVFVALGCRGGGVPNDPTPLEILAVASTAFAAVAAGFSAWNSRTSAEAAREAVAEARTARRDRLAPRLTLERNFLDFEFSWPHSRHSGMPAFLARPDGKITDRVAPTFTLQNFGQAPGLELTIVFELDDPNGELQIPTYCQDRGLTVEDGDTLTDGSVVKMLNYATPPGQGSSSIGLPLSRLSTDNLPNCAPGNRRVVKFPEGLLNRLFLRGLQSQEARKAFKPIEPIVLTVAITSHAMDGTEHKTQFRWEINPYCHNPSLSPTQVNANCRELPMYPKPDGPRVAG